MMWEGRNLIMKKRTNVIFYLKLGIYRIRVFTFIKISIREIGQHVLLINHLKFVTHPFPSRYVWLNTLSLKKEENMLHFSFEVIP